MAKRPNRKDNVIKLGLPVLRLKTPGEPSVTAPSKTRSEPKKPRQDKANHTNQTGSQRRGKSGASTHKKRKFAKAKNVDTKTLKSRNIVFEILTTVEDGTQLDKALAAHIGLAWIKSSDNLSSNLSTPLIGTVPLWSCGALTIGSE